VFCQSFGFYLNLDLKLLQNFGLWLDLDRSLKIPDWIWIVKYYSPLISGGRPQFSLSKAACGRTAGLCTVGLMQNQMCHTQKLRFCKTEVQKYMF